MRMSRRQRRQYVPVAGIPDSRVIDSRETDEGQAIRRRSRAADVDDDYRRTAVLAVVSAVALPEPLQQGKGDQRCAPGVPRRQVDDPNLLAQQSAFGACRGSAGDSRESR